MKRQPQSSPKYSLVISALLVVIILQWIYIARTHRPEKPSKEAIRPEPKPPVTQAVKGRIAIVLDDWGYNLNNLGLIEEIRYPVTLAVLPNLAFSERIAKELNARGFEVILHLPMEPREKKRLEKNTVMVSMSREKLGDILDDDLAAVPFARGVSNHMGSLATRDNATMEALFRELKKRRLYFLDSYVSSGNTGLEAARKVNLRYARRDVFLDNRLEASYIRRQVQQLKMKAKMRGEAIGIGHDRRATLEVLKEMMPQLAKEGYRFVFVSELVE